MHSFSLRGIAHSLFVLAIPIICQNIITFGVALADNVMVGRLGEAAINGLYIASIIQFTLQMILSGVDSAMSVLTAQFWGRNDTESIKTIVAICTRAALAIALVATLATFFFPREILSLLTDEPDTIREGARYLRTLSVSYTIFAATMLLISAMRSVEVVRIGLVNSIVALICNVGLNYLLIEGRLGFPALGVEGAAWATDISRIVEFSVILIFVLRLDSRLRIRVPDFFRRDPALTQKLIHYGTPLMAGQIVWAINKFAMRAIVGHFAPSSTAAISIAECLDSLLWVGTVGLAAAMAILTGKMIGANAELSLIKRYARSMQCVFASIGILSFLTVHLIGDLFLSFYSIQPETIATAKTFLVVLSFAVLGRSYQAPCLMGLVKAGGSTSFVFKNDTFWVFCFVLPSALLARYAFHAPDWVVYACLLSDQVTKCAVAFIKINRFHWMKNLTHT